MDLIQKIEELRNSEVKKKVDKALKGFKTIGKKGNKEWFSELCYCLLTANTSAVLGMKVQNALGYTGFTTYDDEKHMAAKLKEVKYRFYNKRAEYICKANRCKNIKDILMKEKNKRDWLVENIKGLGYKEASHFLRNVGFFDYAILDKHIQNLMFENGLIDEIPKTMNKKNYEKLEKELNKLTEKLGMTQGELDLYMWYMKTGKVLK